MTASRPLVAVAALRRRSSLPPGVRRCRPRPPQAASPGRRAAAVDVPAVKAAAGTIESTLELSGNLAPRSARRRQAARARCPRARARRHRRRRCARARRSPPSTAARSTRRPTPPSPRSTSPRPASKPPTRRSPTPTTEHERAQNLFEKGALPRQRLDAAETAHKSASAQRELARANLAQAEAALRRAREVQRDTTLTSPVDRLRRRAQLRPGRDSRRRPGRRRRRPARAEARSRRLGARGRPAQGRHARRRRRAGAAGRALPRPARRDRAGGRRAQPPLPDRGPRAQPRGRAALGHVCHRAHRDRVGDRRASSCRAKPSRPAPASASCWRSRATLSRP